MFTHPLSAAQAEVAALALGQCAAVAGAPGTGKTAALLALAKQHLEQITPDELIIVTPGRLGAARLNAEAVPRLLQRQPVRSGRLVVTPASLAFQIVDDHFRKQGSRAYLLSGAEEDQLIFEAMQNEPDLFEEKYVLSVGFRSQLRSAIEEILRRRIPLRLLLEQTDDKRWSSLSRLIDKYYRARALWGENRFTAAEIVEYAALLIEKGEDAGFRSVLVDEAQELASEHLRLLSALAANGVGVVAFGDPDKSVFRQAEPGGFLDLGLSCAVGSSSAKPLPEVGQFLLTEVFRGSEQAYEVAKAITSRIGASGMVQQRASAYAGSLSAPISRFTAPSRAMLISTVAYWLRQKHLLEKIAWEELAVVVPNREWADACLLEFEGSGVPAHNLGGGLDLLKKPVPAAILKTLELVVDPVAAESADMREILLSPVGGFDARLLRLLNDQLKYLAPMNYAAERLRWFWKEKRLEGLQGEVEKAAKLFLGRLEKAAQAYQNGADLPELIWEVWDNAAVKETLLKDDSERAARILAEVAALQQLADTLTVKNLGAPPAVILRRILDAKVPVDNLALGNQLGQVALVTPTSSVGHTYTAVAIIGLQNGVWPSSAGDSFGLGWMLAKQEGISAREYYQGQQQTHVHYQLRQLHQALTRSAGEVFVGTVDNADTIPSVFFQTFFADSTDYQAPEYPPALRGLTAALRKRLENNPQDKAAAAALAKLAAGGVRAADPDNWYGIHAPSGENPKPLSRISPSGLDKFRTCPLSWLVDNLKFSEYQGNAAEVGTAIHAVMHELTQGSQPPNAAQFIKSLEDKLQLVDFESAAVFERERRRLEKTVQKLVDYLQDFAAGGGRLVEGETPCSFAHELPDGHTLTVSGIIDRLEEDKEGGLRVVDLKTGLSSISKLEAEENLQLGLYQLGTEQQHPGKEVSAMLLYPGADTKKVSKREKPPLDQAGRQAIMAVLEQLLAAQTKSQIPAYVQEHCEGGRAAGAGTCQKLLVPQVSWVGGEK